MAVFWAPIALEHYQNRPGYVPVINKEDHD